MEIHKYHGFWSEGLDGQDLPSRGDLLLEELLPTLKLVQQPTLYVVPKSQALVIRAPHAYIDAMGLLGLWNDLLSDIESSRCIPEHEKSKKLAPSVFVAVDTSSPTPDDKIEAQAHLTKIFQNLPSMHFPTSVQNHLPRLGSAAQFSTRSRPPGLSLLLRHDLSLSRMFSRQLSQLSLPDSPPTP
jgi:hypothetical protein